MRRILFWLRIIAQATVEHVVGIRCCACGTRARLPPPPGWRFETCFDGDPRWQCADCRAHD